MRFSHDLCSSYLSYRAGAEVKGEGAGVCCHRLESVTTLSLSSPSYSSLSSLFAGWRLLRLLLKGSVMPRLVLRMPWV